MPRVARVAVKVVALASGLVPDDLGYILLVFALFVAPQLLAPLRLPTAFTALGMGVACGLGFGFFQHDTTLPLLSIFGIVALFLFAGLSVDLRELRQHAWLLTQHILLRGIAILCVALIGTQLLGLEWRAAVVVGLSLLTPSCGFILSSLTTFGLSAEDMFMVRIKAIAAELLALLVLLIATQSTSGQQVAITAGALVLLIGGLPVAMWLFARFVMPRAPHSEFAFLLVLAVVCAYATRLIGAYYLLGAFIAGVVAQRTRAYVPELVSPRIMDAIELFASFFIPFYFFHAGLDLRADDFSPQALVVGAVLVLVVLPLRLFGTMLHRRFALGKPLNASFRVAVALLPTLVFTLVLAQILRERFHVPEYLIGGTIIYTLVATILPGLVLGSQRPVDYTAPEAAPAPDRLTPGIGSRLRATGIGPHPGLAPRQPPRP
jgi:Kef-type K+ transport system membrane component KefB